MLKVIIYIRKSTDSEDRQALSIAKQREACEQLLTGVDNEIIKVYEESITGTKAGIRPGFKEMMKLIKQGKADTIVCWKMSRLARNAIDQAYIETYLQEGKIKRIISTDGIFRPEDNILLMRIYFGVATQYSVDLSKDVKEGMMQKVKQGEAITLPRLGYSRVDGKIQKNSEAPIVREAYKLRRQGMSYRDIGKELYEKFGLTTKQGKPLPSSSIHGTLSNPFYYGAMRYLGEIYKGNHNPIVSLKEWQEANEVRTIQKGDNMDELDFVRGLIKSYDNGNYLSPYFKKGHIYFRSSSEKLNVSFSALIKTMDENIASYIIPKEYQVYLIEGLKDYFYEEKGRIMESKDSIEKKMKKIDGRIANLLEMRMDGELEKEEYLKLKNGEMEKKFSLQENLLKMEALNDDILQKSENVIELLVNLPQTWKLANVYEKVGIIRAISIELFYDTKKSLTIEERDLFREIRNLNSSNWYGYGESNSGCGNENPES